MVDWRIDMKITMDITEEVKKTGFMHWPNDFDGAHQVGGVQAGICRAASDGRNIVVDPPKKIYESPDRGKTVYERDFGSDPSTRKIVQTSVQQQWNIKFKGDPV